MNAKNVEIIAFNAHTLCKEKGCKTSKLILHGFVAFNLFIN